MQLEVSGPMPALAERVVELAREDNGVTAVALYGSCVRGEHSSISDFDICIILTPKPRSSEEAHRIRLKYIEAAGSDSADVQVFQQLPLYVRPTILAEGRMVLVKDEDTLYDLAWETVKDWEDFRIHYEEYLAGTADAEPEIESSRKWTNSKAT